MTNRKNTGATGLSQGTMTGTKIVKLHSLEPALHFREKNGSEKTTAADEFKVTSDIEEAASNKLPRGARPFLQTKSYQTRKVA